MDVKIWERIIVTWLNTLHNFSPITNVNEINEHHLKEVIRKINVNFENNPIDFLKNVFPNFTECNSFTLNSSTDYLCASTLLLIYVSLSRNEDVNEIRDIMCIKLDMSFQLMIVEFLNSVQEHEDAFKFSFNEFKKDIFPHIFFNFKDNNFVQNSVLSDSDKTPIKIDVSNNSYDSPLQGFFQTPKRSGSAYTKKCYSICGDGEHIKRIKKLSDQLVEEESEKTSLQQQLVTQIQKCNDFEMKLKSKIEEIKSLKEDWAKEINRNEVEVNALKSAIAVKIEGEKKFKGEISHLENYISKLESDLSNCILKKDKLEIQLKTTVEKFTVTEAQLKDTSELCAKLQSAINEKEKELVQLKENYEKSFHDEKSIDVTFMNKSFDKSICSPENLGVVVDKLLQEKIEENGELQETIEKLRAEKNVFVNELKLLKDELELKTLVLSEFQLLKKELNSKIELFEKTEHELIKTRNELNSANAEISKLNKENSHLAEKYNILNNILKEREQVLINCNNSKMLLQINFLKLAEDFKAVQQVLEHEVRNISELIVDDNQILSESGVSLNSKEKSEVKDTKNIFTVKTLNSTQNEQNILVSKNETLYSVLMPDDKLRKLLETLQNFECHVDWMESKASLQKTYFELNDNIILLKTKLNELQDHQKNSLETKSKLEIKLKEANEKIANIQSTFASEIKRLQQESVEKDKEIKKLEKCILNHNKKEEKSFLNKEDMVQDSKIPLKKTVQLEVAESVHKKTQTTFSSNVVAETDEKTGGSGERHEFSDSLEEIPVVNKTFDIVSLEEKNICEKTFSIKKEEVDTASKKSKKNSAWVVSPPSKVPLKITSKKIIKRSEGRLMPNDNWTNPLQKNLIKAKKVSSSVSDLKVKTDDMIIVELRKEVAHLGAECDRLRNALLESEQKCEKDKEAFEKNQEIIRQNITVKYESQLEHLKSEIKQLYNRELAMHKQEQSNINSELRDQNKRYKEHIDELRNQLWDLGEKLLQEQTLKRDLERNLCELKEKYENLLFSKEPKVMTAHLRDLSKTNTNPNPNCQKEPLVDESARASCRQMPNVTFPTIPNEDEDEVFDNRFLEDMKTGVCKMERPEERFKELQYRNSLCLPHLKSSYPGETQFHNPTVFKEYELKFGALPFVQENQSLTDSDHSMTKSLLPDNKGKKKEQTSYKRPGPPTPGKHGGRLSIQNGDLRLTPRNILKELNDQNTTIKELEKNKGTPNPLKLLLTSKNIRRTSIGSKDENMAPVTPRKKKFFRKPFGARD